MELITHPLCALIHAQCSKTLLESPERRQFVFHTGMGGCCFPFLFALAEHVEKYLTSSQSQPQSLISVKCLAMIVYAYYKVSREISRTSKTLINRKTDEHLKKHYYLALKLPSLSTYLPYPTCTCKLWFFFRNQALKKIICIGMLSMLWWCLHTEWSLNFHHTRWNTGSIWL